MEKRQRNQRVVGRSSPTVFLTLTFLLTHFLISSLPHSVEAASSSSGAKRVENASTNQGGGTSFSPSFKQQASVGELFFSTIKLSSPKFTVVPQFPANFSGVTSSVPVLTVTVLYAKTDVLGPELPPKTWQKVRNPVFIWEPPALGPDVAGYSIAIDATPDETIDTTATSFNVATDPMRTLADGKHTFAVRAVNSVGRAGPAISMELWVDSTPPQVVSFTPASGALLNATTSAISVTVSDASSGVDERSAMLLVNGWSASLKFDAAAGVLTATGGGWKEGSNSVEFRIADAAGNAIVPLLWSVTVDSIPPTGTISINGGAQTTSSIYVTLNLSASDATSGVSRMLLSNEESSGYVEEPFSTVRELWKLNAIRGPQAVYVKFVDKAGNVSAPSSDLIELTLLSPDTVITKGPSGVSPDRTASFSFMCPGGGCVFSYAFDGDDWSPWSPETIAGTGDLAFGNHYFRVKAARDVNGSTGIQPDEEDPSPAERTWVVGVEASLSTAPKGPPIKLWRLE